MPARKPLADDTDPGPAPAAAPMQYEASVDDGELASIVNGVPIRRIVESAVETAHTQGEDAASYAAGPGDVPEAVPTPTEQPRVLLEPTPAASRVRDRAGDATWKPFPRGTRPELSVRRRASGSGLRWTTGAVASSVLCVAAVAFAALSRHEAPSAIAPAATQGAPAAAAPQAAAAFVASSTATWTVAVGPTTTTAPAPSASAVRAFPPRAHGPSSPRHSPAPEAVDPDARFFPGHP